jgi:hypothetical protein
MDKNDIKLLGDAISQNAEFLADLDFVELEPLEARDLPKNIGLLKNSRIVDEIEEGFFYPGENYEFLKKTIGWNRYESEALPDITEWIERLRFFVANYYESLKVDDDSYITHKRQIYRHVRQLDSKLNSGIREADYAISNEIGNVKTIEDKTRRAKYYLGTMERILDQITRIEFELLINMLPHPSSEMESIVMKIDGGVIRISSHLRSVILKIQKLNISFRKIERRSKKLERLLVALQSKTLELDVDYTEMDRLPIECKKVAIDHITPNAHFNAETPNSFEESRLRDLVARLRLDRNDEKPKTRSSESFNYEKEGETKSEDDVFLVRLDDEKQRICSYLVNQQGAVSLSEYWDANPGLSEVLGKRSWLYEMANWLGELQGQLNGYVFKLSFVETPVCDKSDVYIVTDVNAQIVKTQGSDHV